MLFSGCFYDLIANVFASKPAQTEATLLAAARTAGALLVAGASKAMLTPRFFQAVGRAMELADDQANGGANRPHIRGAFQGHDIMLGANALLAPRAVLAGSAPRRAALTASTRRDLAALIGAKAGARLSVDSVELSGRRFTRVAHAQEVPLGSVDKRLKGVTVSATMPVLVGNSGGRAAVMGEIPEPVTTEREVQAFVESLVKHGQIAFDGSRRTAAATRKSAAVSAAKAVPRETHRVVGTGRKRTLERIRFHCSCR